MNNKFKMNRSKKGCGIQGCNGVGNTNGINPTHRLKKNCPIQKQQLGQQQHQQIKQQQDQLQVQQTQVKPQQCQQQQQQDQQLDKPLEPNKSQKNEQPRQLPQHG